jgi:Trypsin-co-occurring domain 1
MASRIEKLDLEGGGHILIEVHDVETSVERIAITDKAAKTLETAWDSIVPVVRSLSKKLADCGPSEAEIKFGVKIGSDLNAIVASAKGEANFEVSLSWKARE